MSHLSERVRPSKRLYSNATKDIRDNEVFQSETAQAKLLASRKPFPKLTHDETCKLVLLAQAGDIAARSKLLDANVGMVWNLAMKQTNGDREQAQEILPDGICGTDEFPSGLLRAIELFDPERGYKFSTFARHWVKVALRDATLNGRATRHHFELHWQIVKAIPKLVHILDREPTDQEIAEHLNRHWASEGMKKRVNAKAVMSHRLIGNMIATDPSELEQIGDDQQSALQKAIDIEQEDQLREALSQLSELDRSVVSLCYGLNGNPVLSPEAAGQKLGVPRHKIRAVLKSSLLRLKRLMRR